MSSGFTLIELMMALVVSAVLMALGMPYLRDFFLNQQRAGAINEMVTAMQMARGEAYKRGQTVIICPCTAANCVASPPACSTTATDWGKGWIIYANINGDTTGTEPDISSPAAATDDVVVRVSTNDYGAISIGSSGTSTTPAAFFQFQPFGVASTTGTLTFCDSRGASNSAERRAILIVSGTGRPQVSKVAADGSALTCP